MLKDKIKQLLGLEKNKLTNLANYYKIMTSKRQKWRVNMDKNKDSREHIKELGRRIKAYRIMSEMSQQELEEKSGVSKRSISRLEQGESVQTDNLFKIISALGLEENIELLVPDQRKRPSYYLGKKETKIMRVRRKKEKKGFKWGDEL